jgi:hypothetical protein
MATPGRTKNPRRRDARGRFTKASDAPDLPSPDEPASTLQTLYDRSPVVPENTSSERLSRVRRAVWIASAAVAVVLLVLTARLLTSQGRQPVPSEPVQPSLRTPVVTASPTTTPTVRSANGRLTYSGRSSASLGPIQLVARDYTVRWTAVAVADQCIFGVQGDPLDGPSIELVPESVAPFRATLGASATVTLDPGTYRVEVSGSGCEWRLRLIEASPGRPSPSS